MIVPGTTISHYRILDQLGSGGMGVVYRAVDTRLDRTVAIKFLPPHLGANPKARERFIAEAKAASSLDYPTIGTIYEVDETPETGMFIVMAYYAGESLAVRIHRGPLPPAEAVDFAIQVGEGLARAHDRGITHRDVKPGNVMITPGGLVKILDFGLAKVTDISLTDAGLTLGTPAYMSPEQSAGEAVDHRSDIWSLGVVLYHMLSGHLPFDGDSTAEVLRAIRHRDPAPIDCSPALHSVLSRALAKPLRDRYASMRFFVADLRAAHQTVTPPPGYEPTVAGRLTGDEPTVSAVLPAAVPPKSAGELRQLTILACGLAEFGALADALGHEQLSLVLTAFHKVCEEAGHHLEGRIASASEGEVVLHFGLPQAHEDDAVRAVTAGLAIAGETGRLQRELADHIRNAASLPLSIRVGVHTGLVVVDDPGPTVSQHVVVGMTGVVAARTRDAAGGGAVVITEDTSRLVTGAFDLRPLGPASLQGVSRAVSLFHVEGLAPVGGKWEATQAGLNELVGRDRDLGVLADSWQEVKEGNGQVVLISAEAGVGKSRLVAALKSTLAAERHTRLESRCSPYHRNSPLWPIVDLLARGFSLDRSNPPAERFAKMRGILTPHRLATPENLYLMASLLSLPYPETEPRPAIPPQREKERTLALLMNLLRVMSSEQPVLFVVEDLHWADPTTLELLSLVVDQGPTAPLMTVVTFRPEFSSPWGRRAHLTHLTLSRLSRRDAERLVASMTGAKALPRELVAQIVGNADGVPLFLEELTKTLLQSDALQETSSSFEPRLPSSPLAIPATLKDSLMARLDRLGSAKEVAQMAAVLGRTFHYEWLQAISPLGDHLLRQDLLRLVDAELLFQRGVPPDATYTFKHALIKDAAYQALLTPARQHYHARIAHALAERFKDVAETQPELLAHHYAEAGLVEQAISHWQKAGQHAARRSGHVEAAAHFGHALELVRTLPGSADHTQQELDLLVAQGSVLMATMGWAAPAVGDVYTQALHLSGEAGASRRLFDVLQGLVSYYLVRSQHRVARDLSERLVAVAAELNDPALKMEAALRMGISAYVTGSLADAHLHLGSVSTETAPGEPRPPMLYGQDRGVVAQCHWSWVWWLTGFPDRALAQARGALAVALALNHPFSVAWARLYVAIMHSLRGEAEAAAEQADALAAVCTEQAFSYRLAQAEILRGWSQAVLNGDPVPIERIRTGSARIRATGAEAYRPYYAMLYAGACLSVRDWPAGIAVIDDALGLVETTAECFLEAELHRLRGELILASEPSRIDDAVADYQRALEVAARQGALALELRAAASLLRAVPGGPGNRERLASALARTTEGLETVEYASYRSLLT